VNSIKKASPYAQDLIDNLTPFLTFKTWPAGVPFRLMEHGVRTCYFMRKGMVMVYRENGGEEDVLMATFAPPFVCGLGEYPDISLFRLITGEESEIAALSHDETFAAIEKKQLWKLVAQQMQYVSERLFAYAVLVSASNAYEIICHQLHLLMHEPPSLRNAITAEKYIRSKMQISRSSTMRILSDLKTGGYIVIEDGILIAIHHLPARY
jgi:CRP-like cAMP-binding protein